MEHQYILLVIALDQQHCSLPQFLICENNFKTCCYFFSNYNYICIRSSKSYFWYVLKHKLTLKETHFQSVIYPSG